MEAMAQMGNSALVSDLKTSVGKAIAVQRLQRGLTQEQLALMIGVEQETISRIERGAALPTLARLAEIAQVLDVPMVEFVRVAGRSRADAAADISMMLEKLKPEDRRWVRDWVAQMSEKLSRK